MASKRHPHAPRLVQWLRLLVLAALVVHFGQCWAPTSSLLRVQPRRRRDGSSSSRTSCSSVETISKFNRVVLSAETEDVEETRRVQAEIRESFKTSADSLASSPDLEVPEGFVLHPGGGGAGGRRAHQREHAAHHPQHVHRRRGQRARVEVLGVPPEGRRGGVGCERVLPEVEGAVPDAPGPHWCHAHLQQRDRRAEPQGEPGPGAHSAHEVQAVHPRARTCSFHFYLPLSPSVDPSPPIGWSTHSHSLFFFFLPSTTNNEIQNECSSGPRGLTGSSS